MSPKGLPLLIGQIVARFGISRKEAFEVIAKVKENNDGVLRGLKYKKFFQMVKLVIKDRNLKQKEKQKVEAEKPKWKRTCSYCYQKFCDKQAKNRHIKNHHTDIFDTISEVEMDFDNSTMNNGDDVFDVSNVVSSILEEIVNTVVNISRKNCTQKCPECEKSFSHQISLKRHLKEHTVELKYIQCDIENCEFKTLRKDTWWRHRRRIHKVFNMNFVALRDSGKSSDYICKMCKENFKSDANLFESHLVSKACRTKMHNINNDGRYQCDLCPSSYTTKNGLTTHMIWKHKPAQVFSCDACNKTFYNQYSLKRHVKGLHGSD